MLTLFGYLAPSPSPLYQVFVWQMRIPVPCGVVGYEKEVLRRRIRKCLNDLGWDSVQRMILTAKTNLRMAADT